MISERQQHRLMLVASFIYQGRPVEVQEWERPYIRGYLNDIKAGRKRHKDWYAEYEVGMEKLKGDRYG